MLPHASVKRARLDNLRSVFASFSSVGVECGKLRSSISDRLSGHGLRGCCGLSYSELSSGRSCKLGKHRRRVRCKLGWSERMQSGQRHRRKRCWLKRCGRCCAAGWAAENAANACSTDGATGCGAVGSLTVDATCTRAYCKGFKVYCKFGCRDCRIGGFGANAAAPGVVR